MRARPESFCRRPATCGFCISVRELNGALMRVTIEGAPGKIEVQIRLSALNIPHGTIRKFENDW
jgi:hypothetical protein